MSTKAVYPKICGHLVWNFTAFLRSICSRLTIREVEVWRLSLVLKSKHVLNFCTSKDEEWVMNVQHYYLDAVSPQLSSFRDAIEKTFMFLNDNALLLFSCDLCRWPSMKKKEYSRLTSVSWPQPRDALRNPSYSDWCLLHDLDNLLESKSNRCHLCIIMRLEHISSRIWIKENL